MPVRRIRIEDIRVDDLSLADDFAFRVAMKDNTEAVQHIVRTILSRGDIIIRRVRVQDVQESRETHEARLDLLAEDGEGNKIDIEMQKIGKRSMKWLVKRSVYYLGLLITRTLHKKEEYSRARDAIVIFIVDRDIIGKGRAVYSYSLRSDEDNVKLKHAGARIVIANGTYSDDEGSAISEMYRDIYEKDLGKMKVPVLREALGKVKGNETARRNSQSIIEGLWEGGRLQGAKEGKAEGRAEGRAEGIAVGKAAGLVEGKAEGKLEEKTTIARTMHALNYTISQISDVTKLSESEIRKIVAL